LSDGKGCLWLTLYALNIIRVVWLYLLITSQISLQEGITVEALQRHSQILEDIAYATEDRNRFIGTPGHVGTGDYVVAQLEALGGYYDISIQNFTVLAQTEGNGNLSVNGVDQAAALYEYSPGGNITASIIPVANLGCEAVSMMVTLSCRYTDAILG